MDVKFDFQAFDYLSSKFDLTNILTPCSTLLTPARLRCLEARDVAWMAEILGKISSLSAILSPYLVRLLPGTCLCDSGDARRARRLRRIGQGGHTHLPAIAWLGSLDRAIQGCNNWQGREAGRISQGSLN